MKRLLACLLCALLTVSGLAVPAQAEESHTLMMLYLNGRRALADGTWETEPIVLEFDVSQDGVALGTITTSTGETIEVPGTGNLILVPRTVPEEWLISTLGYAVAVTPGALNRASVDVWANAGLFMVSAEPGMSFATL